MGASGRTRGAGSGRVQEARIALGFVVIDIEFGCRRDGHDARDDDMYNSESQKRVGGVSTDSEWDSGGGKAWSQEESDICNEKADCESDSGDGASARALAGISGKGGWRRVQYMGWGVPSNPLRLFVPESLRAR